MKNIYILQTGGTIMMEPALEGSHVEDAFNLNELLEEIPEISKIAQIHTHNLFFEDSSNVYSHHWKQIIESVRTLYDHADGFVVLHGTDTMAYTASAVSFALQGLGKPVIFTGSQVPLKNIRSDARRNLINAIEMATHDIPETAICFNDHLYRGNRSTKISIGDFDAFQSPNFPHLAEIGVRIQLSDKILSRQPESQPEFFTDFRDRVHLIKLYPGFNPQNLTISDNPGIEALVVEAYGTGNFPVKGPYNLLPFLQRCTENGKIVVITSQAVHDAVALNTYEGGRRALDLGVISGGDMTSEACLTKLTYLLGKYPDREEIRQKFLKSLCGERSA